MYLFQTEIIKGVQMETQMVTENLVGLRLKKEDKIQGIWRKRVSDGPPNNGNFYS